MMFLAREARDWSVEMAPRPDDILWENTKYTARSHRRRQTVAEIIVLCLIAVMTLLVIVIVLLIGFVYVSYRFNMHPTQADEDDHPVRTWLTQTLEQLKSSLGVFYGVVVLIPPALFVSLKALSARLLRRYDDASHFSLLASCSSLRAPCSLLFCQGQLGC